MSYFVLNLKSGINFVQNFFLAKCRFLTHHFCYIYSIEMNKF